LVESPKTDFLVKREGLFATVKVDPVDAIRREFFSKSVHQETSDALSPREVEKIDMEMGWIIPVDAEGRFGIERVTWTETFLSAKKFREESTTKSDRVDVLRIGAEYGTPEERKVEAPKFFP
jgi:hypothetical protein